MILYVNLPFIGFIGFILSDFQFKDLFICLTIVFSRYIDLYHQFFLRYCQYYLASLCFVVVYLTQNVIFPFDLIIIKILSQIWTHLVILTSIHEHLLSS